MHPPVDSVCHAQFPEAAWDLASRLGFSLEESWRFRKALTHRSAVESLEESNEQLEFLGDAILGKYIVVRLVREFPSFSVGQLAKAKAYIASEPVLAEAAKVVGIGSALFIGPGEAQTGGRERPSTLSDAFEAVLAAIYLELGADAAEAWLDKQLSFAFDRVRLDQHFVDFKSMLQELIQAQSRQTPTYSISDEWGEDHDKRFRAQVFAKGELLGEGEGTTKKRAEQAAAQQAWSKRTSQACGESGT